MKEIKCFFKVPKDIIKDTTQPMNRVSSYLYMLRNRTAIDESHFSLARLLDWSDINKEARYVSSAYINMCDYIDWLEDNDYLTCADNDYPSKRNHIQTVILNQKMFNPKDNFAIIYDFEIDLIKSCVDLKYPLSVDLLFLALAYIRAYTFVRKNEVTGSSKRTMLEKPEFMCTSFTDMADFLGISRQQASSACDKLEELELIKSERLQTQKHGDEFVRGRVLFVCPYKVIFSKVNNEFKFDGDYKWETELTNGISYVIEDRNKNKKFYQESANEDD